MSNPSGNERTELWAWCAHALLLAGVTGLVYLGSRPEGSGPVRVYLTGPPVLALSALSVGLWGLILALWRRPFLRRGRMAGWFAVGATIALASYPLPFPSRHDGRPSRVLIDLPVEGRWRVQWGGSDAARNLPASVRPDRRYGYDLVPLQDGGAGVAVFAPCDGRVVAAHSPDLSDPRDPDSVLGSRVVLEVAPGEYLFVAGLAAEGLQVAPGAQVSRGAPLGRVAERTLSPFTRGPHLILFLADEPGVLAGQGIPLEFAELVVNGERVERARPRGQSVRDAAREPGDVVERVR